MFHSLPPQKIELVQLFLMCGLLPTQPLGSSYVLPTVLVAFGLHSHTLTLATWSL